VPVMSTNRVRSELGWHERHSSEDALMELLAGMREGAGTGTPPLQGGSSGPMRIKELLTGLGGRNP
jgi:UDP-glucose 4-epimerase